VKKYITLLLSAVLICLDGFAQSKDSVYRFVETFPEPGFDINQFLSKNIQYPQAARYAGIAGRVVTTFIITETGDIDSINIANPIHPLLAAEAVRVIKKMPKWKPGRNETGRPVKVFFTFPIKFSLDGVRVKRPPTVLPISGPVYTEPDTMPVPPEDLLNFFGENAWLPEDVQSSGVNGEMIVRFIVNKQGELDSFRMQQFLHPTFDAMVMYILDYMPPWKPGMKDGQPANTYQTLAVKLNNGRISVKTIPPPISGPIYTYVDQMPEPGYDVNQYISSALLSTSDSSYFGLQGKVVLRFIITQSGSIDSVSVIKSLSPAIDQAIVYTAQNMPKWKPGTKDGVPVNVYYTIPVPIKIQTAEQKEDSVRFTPDTPPDPGYDVPQYLAEKGQYPPNARENNITGRVEVRFIVDETGNISNIEVVKSVHPELDAEMVRLVKAMPKWKKSAMDKGKAVKSYYTLPMKFSLN
jgi:TonB family protein